MQPCSQVTAHLFPTMLVAASAPWWGVAHAAYADNRPKRCGQRTPTSCGHARHRLLVQVDGEHGVGAAGVGVHVGAGRGPDLGPVRQALRHVLQTAHGHQVQARGHVVAVLIPLQVVALGGRLAMQQQVSNLM